MPLPRLNSDEYQQQVVLTYDAASANADRTDKLFKVPAGKKFRVDQVRYVNAIGLAGNGTNFFNIKVLKGAATVAFNWSTDTGAQGTIAANTFVDFVGAAADADKVLAGDEELSVFFDLTGTATLPAGRLVVLGRYV